MQMQDEARRDQIHLGNSTIGVVFPPFSSVFIVRVRFDGWDFHAFNDR
jgi:hypothetical protein